MKAIKPVVLIVAGIVSLALITAGIALASRGDSPQPTASNGWKTVQGEAVSFSYPTSWKISTCASDEPFIIIPGTIAGIYKDSMSYPLAIDGTTTAKCTDDRQYVAWIHQEASRLSQNCEAQNTGERLSNGVYLDVQEHADFEGTAWLVHVRQNSCYVDTDQSVVTFSFTNPQGAVTTQDILRYGEPRVDIEKFKQSPQYKDIRRFAESLKES